ncbi:MAG: hypothetical protein J0M11_11520 [Anaerolineae bacterium]|nr:hypothetical protein [Anaerolineae bacterium]
MKKDKRKMFYYVTTIGIPILSVILASNINLEEVIINGLLSAAVLLLMLFYITHTDYGGTFDETFQLLPFIRSAILLFVLSIILYWATENIFDLFFYITGV